MYVTGGQYKGHKIIIPDCAKPTLSKVRQGVFNVLFSKMNGFEGKLFLDLFSGSGLMSMEALSRGFSVISIEKNHHAAAQIAQNLKIAKTNYKIINGDAFKIIEKENFAPDVIYIDPPWDMDYSKILEAVFKNFKSTVVVIEYDKKRAQELCAIYAKNSQPFKEKIYGRCKLDFLILS